MNSVRQLAAIVDRLGIGTLYLPIGAVGLVLSVWWDDDNRWLWAYGFLTWYLVDAWLTMYAVNSLGAIEANPIAAAAFTHTGTAAFLLAGKLLALVAAVWVYRHPALRTHRKEAFVPVMLAIMGTVLLVTNGLQIAWVMDL